MGLKQSSLSSLGWRKRSSAPPSKRSISTLSTTTTESISPYDYAFQQNFIDHDIYPDGYKYLNGQGAPPPSTVDEILQALAQPRRSLSPFVFTDDDFRKFKRADSHGSKQSQITSTAIPIVKGDVQNTKCTSGQMRFTNLDHLTSPMGIKGKNAEFRNHDRLLRAGLSGWDQAVQGSVMLMLLPGGDKRDASWIGHEREEKLSGCKEVTRRPLHSS